MSNFETELSDLINRHCMENGSNTPDFILARFLVGCLESYNQAISSRGNWYGREKSWPRIAEGPNDNPGKSKDNL